jgi:uncharacterized membrane protein YdbT with pleckstrin-like domain
MGFPQSALSDDETLVLVLRKHVKVLFVPFLLFLVLVAVVVALFLLLPAGAWPWGWLAVAALVVVVGGRWVLWPFLVWWNTVYAISTRRLLMREGVFSRSGHDMPLSRLNDVSFEHNVFERMLGCGRLIVESAGERGQIELDDVPKVEVVQRTLYRLSDDARGVDHDAPLDPKLARRLDAEFDDEYRGPQT